MIANDTVVIESLGDHLQIPDSVETSHKDVPQIIPAP